MVRYFPNLLPDELLYSVFSRYTFRTGENGFKVVSRELFGTENIVACWELPSHIQQLVDNIVQGSHRTDDIINAHTMLPLFYPFLDKERQEYALTQMTGDNGKGIYMKLGIMPSSVRTSKTLKCCPMCINEDIAKYQTAYWHRSHNAPGVEYCHKHGIALSDRCPECDEIIAHRSKNQLIPLLSKCKYGHKLSFSPTSYEGIFDSKKETKMNISKAVHYLLGNGMTCFGLERVYQIYLYFLKQKGLITPKGVIRQNDLLEQFCLYYGNEYLDELGLGIEKESEHNWLSDMLRRTGRAYHPLKHILLIIFLSGSMPEFFNYNYTEYKPFGEAPWLCLNPVADHYGKPVVDKCNVTICTDTRRPVGTFTCSCGFVYSRRGPDLSEDDKYKIGRIKVFGQVWEDKLKELVKHQGGSLRSIAKAMKADPMTIKKFIEKLELNGTSDNNPSSKLITKPNTVIFSSKDEKSKQYAENIKIYVSQSMNISRSMVREKLSKEYTWLYRYNKELLLSILPEPIMKRGNGNKPRVNWVERDAQIYEMTESEIKRILSTKKPERVTLSRIGRNLGILPLLEQHLDKMPKTKQLLKRYCETIEVYQRRRVLNIVENLQTENKVIKSWVIIRKAGLRKNATSAIET